VRERHPGPGSYFLTGAHGGARGIDQKEEFSMRTFVIGSLTLLAGLVISTATASAQVLIWSLPKADGAWVRFEGTYKQTRARPATNAGEEVLEWRSELTISAVGSEAANIAPSGSAASQADVKNEVLCRWVEFKTLTKPNGLEKQPGPGDLFIYKVLIPEYRVIGKPVDDDSIPVTFLPIVKGWRKVGQRDAEPVTEKALAVYPTVALVTYYPNLAAEGEDTEQIQAGDAAFTTRIFKGARVYQKLTNRSTNIGTLWRSDDVPFGLARFQVSVTLEDKEIAAPVDEFKRTSLIEVDMSVVATGEDARSELGDQPAEDSPAGEQPAAAPAKEEPGEEQPEAEMEDDDGPADKKSAEKGGDDQPGDDEPASDKPADEPGDDDQPANEKTDDEPSADENSDEGKGNDEPAEEMPAADSGDDDQPANEKTDDEPSADENSDAGEPADELPADEN
jgi:hypothetical protein